MNIEIPDDRLTNLSHAAKTRVSESAKVYVDHLVSEASRFEAAQRASNAHAEITESHVVDASQHLNSPVRTEKPSATVFAARLVTYVSAGFFGYGLSALDSGWGQLSFAGGVLVGAIAMFVEFARGKS